MRSAKLLLVGTVLFLAVGCATSSHAAAPKSHGVQSGGQVEVSRIATYQTMAALRKDSTAVLLVTATTRRRSTAADQEGQGPLQAVLTTVRVNRVISGSVATRAVEIRELRVQGGTSQGLPPLLTPGQMYDLYVTPFEFVHGHPIPGIYVVTGDVGLFHVDADGTVHRTLPNVGGLPTALSQAQLERDAKR